MSVFINTGKVLTVSDGENEIQVLADNLNVTWFDDEMPWPKIGPLGHVELEPGKRAGRKVSVMIEGYVIEEA